MPIQSDQETTPDGNNLLAPEWIERAVVGLPDWPHGPVQVVDVTRIGEEHGLSGQVYRVAATDQGGSRTTFIVKHETRGRGRPRIGVPPVHGQPSARIHP